MNWNLPLLNDSMGCACNCWQSWKRFRCKHVKDDGEVAEGIVVAVAEHNDEEDNEDVDDVDDDEDDDDDVSMGGTTNAPDGAVDVVSGDCCKEQEPCNDEDDIVVDVVDCDVTEEFDVEASNSLLFWYVGIVSGVLGTCGTNEEKQNNKFNFINA